MKRSRKRPEWVEYYNQRAIKFEDPRDIGEFHLGDRKVAKAFLREEARRLRSLLQPAAGATLLDLGCCAGVSLGMLKPWFKSCIGVDLATDALEKARQIHPDCEFVLDDMTRLKTFQTASMKYIIGYGVMHYLGSERRVAGFLKAMARVLAPGGRAAVIRIPDRAVCKQYQAFRKSRKRSMTSDSPSWLWIDESAIRRYAKPFFDVIVIRPPAMTEMPLSAFYDLLLIRKVGSRPWKK